MKEKNPVWMDEKWVRKLKLEMSSTNSKGKTWDIKLIIKGKPLIVKTKETTIDRIKEIIWLLVKEEKNTPKDMYEPAMIMTPKYWPKIIRLSGSPK